MDVAVYAARRHQATLRGDLRITLRQLVTERRDPAAAHPDIAGKDIRRGRNTRLPDHHLISSRHSYPH
jgi:hypothetical protein